MEAWHQKNLLRTDSPFNIFLTDIAEFPPHWHEEFEIVYVLDEKLDIGLNNEVYTLEPRDMLLIGIGDVHYFLTRQVRSQRVILQFKLSLFESSVAAIRDKKFISPLIKPNERPEIHRQLETSLLAISQEYQEKNPGYTLAIKARMYDFLVTLIRYVPMDTYCQLERARHLNRLERLEQVFKYVDQNHMRQITLSDAAEAANFSIYHFTRFFKEATGMTFINYLNNYRISKAIQHLQDSNDPITEIAFQSGFESIKTFNRVFKQLKGCSPTQYRKLILNTP